MILIPLTQRLIWAVLVAISTTAPIFAQDAPSKNPPQELTVIAGPLESERRELLGMINAAEKKGVNIRTYMDNFKYIEDRIAHGATELTLQPRLERVKQALEDQLRMREFYQNEQTKPIAPKVVKATEKENTADKSKLLTLEEARNFMVTLINRDRAKHKLKPVTLDLTASLAGQKHSDEMAASQYLSHWNLAGKKPTQRYTESGGMHSVSENLSYGGDNIWKPPANKLLFSATQIERAENMLFNQSPPNDLHRAQILRPEHNKVGIGISISKSKQGWYSHYLAQEFINQYGTFEKIPMVLQVGKQFQVKGRLSPGFFVYDIQLCWEEFPKPMTVEDLNKTYSYTDSNDEWLCVADKSPDFNGMKITKKKNAEFFSINVKPSSEWKPGLYYLNIKARRKDGEPIEVSSRTLILKKSATTNQPPSK